MPIEGTPITGGGGATKGTRAYFQERVDARYDQLEELEETAAQEYTLDNASSRQSVTYRSMDAINKQIERYEKKIAKFDSKGGKALAVLRRGGY